MQVLCVDARQRCAHGFSFISTVSCMQQGEPSEFPEIDGGNGGYYYYYYYCYC